MYTYVCISMYTFRIDFEICPDVGHELFDAEEVSNVPFFFQWMYLHD